MDARRLARQLAPHLGIAVLLFSLAGVALWIKQGRNERLWFTQNEMNAPNDLWLLVAVEDDCYRNDRDGNGVQDYWTRDVAGLRPLSISASAKGVSIPTIPERLAAADGSGGSVPCDGYYFKAVQFDAAGSPRGDRSTTGFAFCAYPAEYGRTGARTFVISEGRKVYQLDNGGKPVDRWEPDSPTWTPKR